MAEQGKNKKETKAAAAKPAGAIPAPPASSAGLDAATAAGLLHGQKHGFRRKLVGKVTSDKMNKTVTVEVIRNQLDPVYKKYVRMRERYKAHDETNQYKTGDRVEITEYRPLSRTKRWMVTKLVVRPVVE
jgi:small subunit ribosomal protein S17